MEGHAEMDMSVTGAGSLWQRMTSDRGLTAINHYFVMDWAAVWLDIVGGLLIAGALAPGCLTRSGNPSSWPTIQFSPCCGDRLSARWRR